MRVLDHHKKRSRRPTRSLTGITKNGVSARTPQENLVTPPPRSTRLRDQLIEKFHQQDAELVFDVRSIRRKLNYRENLDQRPRKLLKREAIDCRCYFAVWDNRQGHRQLEPILKRSEVCLVTPADTASDAHAVDIDLEGPFRVPAREFFVPLVDKNGHVARWAIGDKYLLEIKIIPCHTSELWPPIPILSKSEDSLMRDFGKRNDLAFIEGMLISNYTNLPHAPPDDVPLNIAFDQGGRTFKTKYGLEVNAEWTYPHAYDARIKKEEEIMASRREKEEKADALCLSIESGRNAKARRPRLSEPKLPSPFKPKVKVSYIWDIETQTPVPRDFRTVSLEGLQCPVCHTPESPSLKRLQFHFCNNHDKYKFSIESKEHDPSIKRLVSVTIRVEVAEIVRPRAANHVKDEREFSWERPERPFDIDAYVSGEQSWAGALPRRRTATTQSQPASTLTPTISIQSAAVLRRDTFRSSIDVPEIPLPVHKKFQIPKSKTRRKTSFYRSINHRATETGEKLSETDDDIDDDWLIKRQRDTIDDTKGLSRAEKEFRQRWNAHVISEGCPGARYTSDSLVRFVRRNAAWLRGDDHDLDMFAQFQDLATKLTERGVIDSRVLNDCSRMIRDRGDSWRKETTPTNKDVFGLVFEAASAARNDPSSSEEAEDLNLHKDIVEEAEGIKTVHDDNDRISEAARREKPNRTENAQHSEGNIEKATTTSTPDPQSTAAAPMPQSTTSEPKSQYSPANGFCGICNKYIDRPKRNAITCSYHVSLIQFFSFNAYFPRTVFPFSPYICPWEITQLVRWILHYDLVIHTPSRVAT